MFWINTLLWFCFRCAFIRGEYTENVSISCTEATHPAQCYCPNDVNAEVSDNVTFSPFLNVNCKNVAKENTQLVLANPKS